MKFLNFIYDNSTSLGNCHGFIDGDEYHDVLFSFLDKNNEFGNDFPLHCRAILILSMFKKEMRPIMYILCKKDHIRPDFQGVYDYLNLSFCIKKTSLNKIQERIDFLNNLKESLGIEENLTLNLLQENIYASETENNWDCFLLKGSNIWQSSGAIISFFTGIIKYGFSEIGLRKILDIYTVQDFVLNYSKSNLYTSNPILIEKYFSDNKWSSDIDSHNIYTQTGVSYFLENS